MEKKRDLSIGGRKKNIEYILEREKIKGHLCLHNKDKEKKVKEKRKGNSCSIKKVAIACHWSVLLNLIGCVTSA